MSRIRAVFLVAWMSKCFFYAWAQDADFQTSSAFPKTLGIKNTIQAGIEYDTNVFKTFGASQNDFLTRILFKSRGAYLPHPQWKLGWNYQGGGKKYFDLDPQDTLIQYVKLPIVWGPLPFLTLTLSPEFKYQNEKNKIDPSSIDINEDFFSTTIQLRARISLPKSFWVASSGAFTYFSFDPTDNFSFYREWGSVSFHKNFERQIHLGIYYSHIRQQFQASSREDQQNQISGILQYLRVPFVSARYTYQNSDSSNPTLSFTNHKVSLILSLPFGSREPSKTRTDIDLTDSSSLFALHVLGTLQLKRFPSVFNFTDEGTRFLLTGAEDENFNSILIKLSYHPESWMAVEGKYTRYSNELSSQQDSFSRSLFYGGVRIIF